MTKSGDNARKRAARDLAATEHIPYTEALRRLPQRTAGLAEHSPDTAALRRRSGSPSIEALRRLPLSVPESAAELTLTGHNGGVWSVAFHPSGRLVASGGTDGVVGLWDLSEPDRMRILDPHGTRTPDSGQTGRSGETRRAGEPAVVASVAFDASGDRLAIGDKTNTVSVWHLDTGEIRPLIGCAAWVESVAFHPEGRLLASSEWQPRDRARRDPVTGGTVRLWDLASGEHTVVCEHPTGYGYGLAFSPDGAILATSAGRDGTVELWDLAARRARVLAGHTSGVNAVAFSPDGRSLATASTDLTARVWDVASGRTRFVIEPHGHYVQSVAFSPDGRTLAVTTIDPVIGLWDAATGAPIARLTGSTDEVRSVAFSPDGRQLVGAGSDRAVRVWTLP